MALPIPRRLDKFLADARVGSRADIEALIAAGSVRVNGAACASGRRILDPLRDEVRVAGARVALTAPRVYALLHKPAGVVTTLSDPKGKRCVAELLPAHWQVGVVGRLDKPTTGALLVTDDGDLSHLLTSPEFHVWKRYVMTVVGVPDDADPRLAQLRAGVALGPDTTLPARCGLVPGSQRPGRGQTTLSDVWLELREGRFRQVRRMASQVGLKLARLHRAAIGPLALGALQEGAWRPLEAAEVDALYAAAGGRDAPLRGARRALRERLESGALSPDEAAIVRRYFAALG